MNRNGMRLFCLFCVGLVASNCTVSTENEVEAETAYERPYYPVLTKEIVTHLPSNPAVEDYQSKYIWKKGMDALNHPEISVRKSPESFIISFTFQWDEDFEFPMVKNRDFKRKEQADYLSTSLKIKNDKNHRTIRLKERESVASVNRKTIDFEITPADYKNMVKGTTNFTVNFSTKWESFFGVADRNTWSEGSIIVPFNIPKLYQTTLYFKALKLNEDKVTELLGTDNDWNDPKPEAGIRITCNDQPVLYGFSKNQFEYTTSEEALFYHLSEDDLLHIRILDVDYGFNGSDLITDTLIGLKGLNGETYHNISLPYTDQLLLYTKFNGVVND